MKLRYIFGALVSALLFAGCEQEAEIGQFSDFNVDKTFVSIDMAGGTAEITLNAPGDWEVEKIYDTGKKDDDGKKIYDYYPSWVSLDKVSGEAGETKLTVTAAATEGGRETEIKIKSGTHAIFFIVRQGSLEAVEASCADVLAGPDGKSFQVKGKVTSIANTLYGNWYLDDGTGVVYIYGTLDADGKEKNFTSLGIEIGDIVTVQGPKSTYNGTVELVNVTDLNIEKALLSILSDDLSTVVKAGGGDFEVPVAYKGKGAFFSIQEDAKDWIQFKESEFHAGVATIFEKNPADTVVFRFNVKPNEGSAPRKGVITFESSDLDKDGKAISTTADFTVKQQVDNPKGTLDNPYTPSEIAAELLGGETFSENLYIKGTISAVLYYFSSNHGTATFWISDDGKAYGISEDKKKTTDPAHDFECYSVYWFGSQPWADGNAQIEVGDEVIILGKTTVYGGVAETDNKKAWVYSVNGATDGANGVGNAVSPFNIAGASALITSQQAAIAAAKEAGKPDPVFPDVCVKGKISAILYTFSANYGTSTFWISDDGNAYGISEDKKKTTDPAHDFECYGLYYFNNTPWAEGNKQIAVGDDVIVKGQLTLYSGTYETSNKKAWLYSLNGATE